jgi:hypothetical protein
MFWTPPKVIKTNQLKIMYRDLNRDIKRINKPHLRYNETIANRINLTAKMIAKEVKRINASK